MSRDPAGARILRRALKNLVAFNLRSDPTDEDRPQVKAAILALQQTKQKARGR